MQVTETVSEASARVKVVVARGRSGHKADAKLGQLKDQVRINGFRPARSRRPISSASMGAP